MKEKSILEMVGGEKHINPHYNIKTEELKDEMKNRISLALKDPILQQGFEIICKENAELKHQLEHRNCLDCSNHSSNLRMRNLDLEKENCRSFEDADNDRLSCI